MSSVQRIDLQAPLKGSLSGTAIRPSAYSLPLEHKSDLFSAKRRVIRFSSASIATAGKHGLFITPEWPAIVGGLGKVSVEIPMALNNKTSGGMDVRLVVPYLKHLVDADASSSTPPDEKFVSTGLFLGVEVKGGVKVQKAGDPSADGIEKFEVMQKFDKKNNTTVYALKSDKYFSHLKDLYSYTNPYNTGGKVKTSQGDTASLPEGEAQPNWDDYYREAKQIKADTPDKEERKKKLEALISKPQFNSPGVTLGRDPILEATLMFCKAAAKLVPELSGDKKEHDGKPLKRFEKGVEFLICNDAATAPVMEELPENSPVAKVFMLHNEYETPISLHQAKKFRMKIPAFMNKDGIYSPLSIGFKADTIIANWNYVKSILQRKTGAVINYLSQKMTPESGGKSLVFDVHHDPGDKFNPINNPVLQNTSGFTAYRSYSQQETVAASRKGKPGGFIYSIKQKLGTVFAGLAKAFQTNGKKGFLNGIKQIFFKLFQAWANALKAGPAPKSIQSQKTTPIVSLEDFHRQEFARFKRINKLGLQSLPYVNLKKDDKAIIFSWLSRQEPNQKGFFLVANTLKNLMLRNEHVQVIIAGGEPADEKSKAIVEKVFDELEHDPRLKGRFVHVGKLPYDEGVKLMAGSDFSMLPSLYEPYGLTQLEAMKMGTIPVAHAVDGLLSSVIDPDKSIPDEATRKFYAESHVPSFEKYGQTGIIMNRIHDIPAYQKAMWAAVDQEYSKLTESDLITIAGDAFNQLLAQAKGQPADEVNTYLVSQLKCGESNFNKGIKTRIDKDTHEVLSQTFALYRNLVSSAVEKQPEQRIKFIKASLDNSTGSFYKSLGKLTRDPLQKSLLASFGTAFKDLVDQAASVSPDEAIGVIQDDMDNAASAFSTKLDEAVAQCIQTNHTELDTAVKAFSSSYERALLSLKGEIKNLESRQKLEKIIANPAKLWSYTLDRATGQHHGLKLSSTQQAVLANAENSFVEAMERAVRTAEDRQKMATIGLNAMRYVNTEHRWSKIVGTYKEAINEAIIQKDKRLHSQTAAVVG